MSKAQDYSAERTSSTDDLRIQGVVRYRRRNT